MIAEPDEVTDIIASCARLPLALAIVASRGASHPGFDLRDLAEELDGAGRPGGAVPDGDGVQRRRCAG